MNPKLEALFDEPEKGYLQPEDLNALSQFVSSLPERVNLYRRLRDEEVAVMQPIADALRHAFPQASEEQLKRSLQNGILTVRYAAMAMLMDDPEFVTKRLETWLPEIVAAYDTQAIDEALHQLIRERFSQHFGASPMALFLPGLDAAQALISSTAVEEDETTLTSETLVSLF